LPNWSLRASTPPNRSHILTRAVTFSLPSPNTVHLEIWM
jgi:hypothetical protein